jgi:putative membrane protein
MRITIALILALILALIVTIFAVQNNTTIEVTFLAWSVDGSLALMLIITFALGILLGLLVSTPAWFRRIRQSANLRRNIRDLEMDLEKVRSVSAAPSGEQPEEESEVEIPAIDEPKDESTADANQGL